VARSREPRGPLEFREKIETAISPLIAELRTKLARLPTLDTLNNYQLRIHLVQTDKSKVPDGFMFKWRYLWALSLSADFRDRSLGAEPNSNFHAIDQLVEKIYDTYSVGAVYDPGRVRGSEREFLARLGLAIRVREPDVLAFPEQIRDWGRKRLEPFNESYFLPKFGVRYDEILAWLEAAIGTCQTRLNGSVQELASIARDVRPIEQAFSDGSLEAADAQRKADELQVGERLESNWLRMEQMHVFSAEEIEHGVSRKSLDALLMQFGIRPGQLAQEFRFPHDENPLENKLFVNFPGGKLYFLDPASAFRVAVKTFEKEILEIAELRVKYLRNRDRSAERWVAEKLRKLFPSADFFANYFLTKGSHEKDLLIRFGDTVILIECKNTKLRAFTGTAGDLLKYEADFDNSVQHGFEQALEVKRRIVGAEESVFLDEKGRPYFSLNRADVQKIYIMCVTMTARGPFGTDLSYELRKPAGEPFPLALNLFDLATICEYFQSAEQLVGYLEARELMHGRVRTGDELNFAGYYLKFGHLNVADNAHLMDEFSAIFDRAWFRKMGIEVAEPLGPPVSTSMVRRGNRVRIERDGAKAETINVPSALVEMASGRPTIRMKGSARNKPCPCGSGRKLKHCHGV